MGLYERDYYRDEQAAMSLRGPTRMVAILIGINVAVYVLDFLVSPEGSSNFQEWFAVTSQTLESPWSWYRFLTYGFVHSQSVFHVFGNMLMLYFFGASLESRLGRFEFLRFYLVCLVFGSVAWAVLDRLAPGQPAIMFGASGAVAGVVILFAQCFPRATIVAFFIIPMPAWVFGVIFVGLDTLGVFGHSGGDSNVAYSVHLAGAAFALLYGQLGWNFGRLVTIDWRRFKFRGRSRFRVYSPEQDDANISEDEVDRILAKLYREGESSLTSRERKTLQEASREYQRKRHQDPSEM